MLAKRQPVLHVSQPVAGERVAGRPPEPDRQADDQGQGRDHGQREHDLLALRKDVGDHDRRDRAQAARDQDEHDQVDQEHGVKGRRCLDREPVGRHERAAQQEEAPARNPDRLGELVGEDPVGRGRRGQQEGPFARMEQGRVGDDSRREEEHDRDRQEEHAEQVLEDRMEQLVGETDELEPAQEQAEKADPEDDAAKQDHREPQPRAGQERADRVAGQAPAQMALPGGPRACLRRPPSLASHRMMLGLRRVAPEIKTVIDGGANIGQFARAATETYPAASIFSFEPLPAAAAQFRRNLVDRPQVRLIQSALGSGDGTVVFHPNEYSQSSSALPQTAMHARSFSQDKQLTPIEVPITRLDTFASGKALAPPILIKLDLQGFELEALKGGPELLRRTEFVLAETVFEPMYEGEPLFADILSFMNAAGFAFRIPLAPTRDERDLIVQMDALFVRNG